MANRDPLSVGEWYHCYTRGVDKRKIFLSPLDYERFLLLLYASNSDRAVHVSNLKQRTLRSLPTVPERGPQLTEIGGYCLMPNHVHLIVKENTAGGIARFMQKLFTGYTMYFNKRNERTGALFSGSYKSKHLYDDEYLKHALAYVHVNPLELRYPDWKERPVTVGNLEKALLEFKYSSWPDFLGTRPESAILGTEIFDLFDRLPTTREIIDESQIYEVEDSETGARIKVKP